ncbi:unnamed protein product [Schistosoma turkestanicum]|nr:unnamed protein product [Schistosoma turkestanicum]
MSCPICENRQLVEDENTGQLICSECGTATGVYRGATQSQDFSETRGLRVIQKTEHLVSQSNQAATDNLPDTSRHIKVEPDDIYEPNMIPVSRDSLPNSIDDLFCVNEVSTNSAQKEKRFERYRPWRLSEPFTFIMRRQANCLAKELDLSVEQKVSFCDTVWNIWLHYLAITGELGSDAWVNAALLLANSIGEVLKGNIITSNEKPTYKILRKHKTSNHCYTTAHREYEWELMKSRISQFQWVGWGILYEPQEGREIGNVLQLCQKNKASKQVKKSDGKSKTLKQRGRKRKDITESDSSESVPPDDNYDAQSVHSFVDNDGRDLRNLKTHDPDLPYQSKAVESELFPNDDCTQETLSPYFTKKLSRSQAMGQLIWRGQIEGRFNCRVLMEHNLAVLFIACLTTFPVRRAVNPLFSSQFINPNFPNIPCALTTMITLKDLQDLCISHRLPFISVEGLFPPGAFCIRDQSLLGLIRRHRPPEIDHLAYATARMREFIGLNHFPKYPLSWLMHRHITALGLPVVMHTFVQPLLERLQQKCTPVDKYIHYPLLNLIPWPRVVRPEVFAMALVVILLRLVFKFNDVFEHRLSSVAKALELFPNRPVKNAQTSNISLYDRPFIWISWVQYIDSRFHPSHKLNLHSSKSDLISYSNARVRESNQPLVLTASQGSELLNLDKASDFLGSTEFKVGRDIGWGEKSMKKIKVADNIY